MSEPVHPTIRRLYAGAITVCALGAALGAVVYWHVFVGG